MCTYINNNGKYGQSKYPYLNNNRKIGQSKYPYLNNNGKFGQSKYPYLNDNGKFWFPLLALLALCPMSFKKGPKVGIMLQ